MVNEKTHAEGLAMLDMFAKLSEVESKAKDSSKKIISESVSKNTQQMRASTGSKVDPMIKNILSKFNELDGESKISTDTVLNEDTFFGMKAVNQSLNQKRASSNIIPENNTKWTISKIVDDTGSSSYSITGDGRAGFRLLTEGARYEDPKVAEVLRLIDRSMDFLNKSIQRKR